MHFVDLGDEFNIYWFIQQLTSDLLTSKLRILFAGTGFDSDTVDHDNRNRDPLRINSKALRKYDLHKKGFDLFTYKIISST